MHLRSQCLALMLVCWRFAKVKTNTEERGLVEIKLTPAKHINLNGLVKFLWRGVVV